MQTVPFNILTATVSSPLVPGIPAAAAFPTLENAPLPIIFITLMLARSSSQLLVLRTSGMYSLLSSTDWSAACELSILGLVAAVGDSLRDGVGSWRKTLSKNHHKQHRTPDTQARRMCRLGNKNLPACHAWKFDERCDEQHSLWSRGYNNRYLTIWISLPPQKLHSNLENGNNYVIIRLREKCFNAALSKVWPVQNRGGHTLLYQNHFDCFGHDDQVKP